MSHGDFPGGDPAAMLDALAGPAVAKSGTVTHPVVGVLVPTMLAILRPDLDTGYQEFVTPTVQGLARVTGDRLDLLAIGALNERRGDVGRFLAECQAAYRVVGVWIVKDPVLAGMLERRGFRHSVNYSDGEAVEGYRWTRP